MYAFCCLSANLFRSWNKQQHNNNLIITGFKTQHMNCYQQHSSIKSNQKLYSFIYFSICDCRMLWNSTFPPLTPDTREALTYLWGIESSKLLKIVFPPFLFSFFILFFFLICRWKLLCWPFQALLAWNTARQKAIQPVKPATGGRVTEVKVGEGEGWEKWEGTRDD